MNKGLSISVRDVSKQYRLGQIGTGTLRNDLKRAWYHLRGKPDPFKQVGELNDRSGKFDSDWVWALQDINFDVAEGEVLGIIGSNGAGKSTLLKILSKITSPTRGELEVSGRLASLLEVGTGFHPDLTGRENIFMNGAILGMRKWEINNRLDGIIDFSGVEGYIDTPVKRYSSGMKMRLGFAVAAFLDPDILIVDEVLAVGDAEFQKKCLGKINEISKSEGRTVLFVSHNLGAVRNLTTKCIMLEYGKLVYEGKPNEVIDHYLKSTVPQENQFIIRKRVNEFLGKEIEIVDIRPQFIGKQLFFHFGQDLSFEVDYLVKKGMSLKLRFGCTIATMDEQPLVSMTTDEVLVADETRLFRYSFTIPSLNLFPGNYRMSLSIGIGQFTEGRKEFDVLSDALMFKIENLSYAGNSVVNWSHYYGNLLHEHCIAAKIDI